MSKTKLPSVSFFQFEPLCWFVEKPDEGRVENNFVGGYSSGSSNTRVYVTADGLMVLDLCEYEDAGEILLDIDNKDGDSILKANLENRSKVANCLRSTIISNTLIEKDISLELSQPITISNIKTCPDVRYPLNFGIIEGERELVIDRNVLGDAVMKFERMAENRTYLDICNLIYKAHWEFSQGNFTNALIESWTVIEKMINMKWEGFIDKCKSKGVPINSRRKDKLTNGSGFSAYALSEFLSLSGLIDHEKYKKISEIRGVRNKWMHNMVQASDETAAKALTLSTDMYSEQMGFPYRLPITLSVQVVTVTNRH